MFSTARKYMEGHRLELFFMRLWIKLCWLIPVVLELLLRFVLPQSFLVKNSGRAMLLLVIFAANRFLVSPAHSGYYSACYRVACRAPQPALLRTFFAAYRHPFIAIKWQLKWDVFRLLGFILCGLPGAFLLALGAVEITYSSQMLFGVSGGLLLITGCFAFWVVLQRLQLFRYQQYRYKSFLFALKDIFSRTQGLWDKLLKPTLFCVLVFPVSFLFRSKLHVSRAIILHRLPPLRKKVRFCHKIQSRVAEKT